MTDHLNLQPHNVIRDTRADGTVLLRSAYEMGPTVRATGDWVHKWAQASPNAVFLAERSGAGWRGITYAETLQAVRAIASQLLERGMGAHTPILILSGNSVDHGLLTLAAQYVGVPTVPLAEQYSLIPAAHARLIHAVELVKPAMVYASDAAVFGAALDLDVLKGLEVVTSNPAGTGATCFNDLLTPVSTDIDTAFDRVTHDTVAKILLTSGSTSDPKGVLTTQGMMCSNQAQILDALPFLGQRSPRLVDWLPWNHVFGGSYNFNLVLANGGSLYIDDGKPVKGMFERTLENLALVPGTISFNVPVGFTQLVAALRSDDDLRRSYFSELDMIFYAGASLPQATWSALEEMALETGGQAPLITSSWGLTETAPGVLISHQRIKGAGIVGVPMTGLDIKLVPEVDGRFDVRVKGPNVTPGYLNNPVKTQETFDEEGYFITGDAMSFIDSSDPNVGLRFQGRVSEDFKLSTGTWVRAAALRLDVLPLLSPLVTDLVITGQDRDTLAALLVPNREVMEAAGFTAETYDGALWSEALAEELVRRLKPHLASATGSAMRIGAVLVLADPPSMGEGEITAKGNLNFAKILLCRAALVERVYDVEDPAHIDLLGR